MIHQLITQWSEKACIAQLCRLFNVSRSGYYAARGKVAAATRQVCAHSVQAKAVFEASGRCYGSRRLSWRCERAAWTSGVTVRER